MIGIAKVIFGLIVY